MRGEDTFEGKPWDFLRSLSDYKTDWVKGCLNYSAGVQIVGQAYRSQEAQQALKLKRSGNMALLVREPGNSHDSNAIAVLIAAAEKKGYVWTHCGYVQRHAAADLTADWYGSDLVVREASLVSSTRLVLMPKCRTYD